MASIRDFKQDNLDSYFELLSVDSPLSRGEEAALADRIQAGDRQALDQLVRANLRFVVSIAHHYERLLELPELIAAGNLGLVIAAERFDPSRGCKFITYAVWWIRQSILQAIAEQSRLIHLPGNKIGMLSEMRKVSKRLNSESASVRSMEELTEELAVELGVPAGDIQSVLAMEKACCSLDEPFFEGEDLSLADVLADAESELPDAAAIRDSDRAKLAIAFNILDEREREILRLYYGLDDAMPMTLEQIGEVFAVTRERVRQIRNQALAKLRRAKRELGLWEVRENLLRS